MFISVSGAQTAADNGIYSVRLISGEVEDVTGVAAGSSALIANGLDNASDSAVYIITLLALVVVEVAQLSGLATEEVFFKRFFDRYQIRPQFEKREGYKNAVNPFLFDDYTPERREEMRTMLENPQMRNMLASAALDRKLRDRLVAIAQQVEREAIDHALEGRDQLRAGHVVAGGLQGGEDVVGTHGRCGVPHDHVEYRTGTPRRGLDAPEEVLLDPYPAFADLREQGAVVWLPRHGLAALPRFEPVHGVCRPLSLTLSGTGFEPGEAKTPAAIGPAVTRKRPP